MNEIDFFSRRWCIATPEEHEQVAKIYQEEETQLLEQWRKDADEQGCIHYTTEEFARLWMNKDAKMPSGRSVRSLLLQWMKGFSVTYDGEGKGYTIHFAQSDTHDATL